MNNRIIIIHKIALYLKDAKKVKLFFGLNNYRSLINTSNHHYDDLFLTYGCKSFNRNHSLRSIQAIIRLKINYKKESYIMDYVAKYGNLEILKWLHQNTKQKCTVLAMEFAASCGHLEVIKWLDQSGGMCTFRAIDRAAENGHLEIVKWLHENRKEGCTTMAMDWAASNGHLEIVKWLHRYRKEGCTTLAMDLAAKNGHLEVIKFFDEKHILGKSCYRCTNDAFHYAVINGHFEIVKYLHENHFAVSKEHKRGILQNRIDRIIKSGYFDILKFIYENRKHEFIFDNNTINSIIEFGNIEILTLIYHYIIDKKLICENYCNNQALIICCKSGNLEILKWLHSKFYNNIIYHNLLFCGPLIDHTIGLNYPIPSDENNRLEMIKWIHENIKINNVCTTNAIDYAAQKGYLNIIKWLYENRTEGYTSFAFEFAASYNHLEVVKWFFQKYTNNNDFNNISYNNIFRSVARNGHLDMLIWLYEKFNNNITKQYIINALKEAKGYNRTKVVLWLKNILEHFI